jgi:hypothetical protein
VGYEAYSYITTPLDKRAIWRYMSFVKFTDLIERQQLWFQRCDLLDDSREGDFTESEKKQIQSACSETVETAKQHIDGFRQLRSTFFVNCWTKNRESMAMWDLYARDVGSVAVVSTIGRLKRAVSESPEKIGIASVVYENRMRGSSKRSHKFHQFLRKDRAYSYEKEIRMWISDDVSLAPIESERDSLERLREKVRRALRDNGTVSEFKLFSRMWQAAWTEACLRRAKQGQTVQVVLGDLITKTVLSPRSKDYEEFLIKNLVQRHGLSEKLVHRSELSWTNAVRP